MLCGVVLDISKVVICQFVQHSNLLTEEYNKVSSLDESQQMDFEQNSCRGVQHDKLQTRYNIKLIWLKLAKCWPLSNAASNQAFGPNVWSGGRGGDITRFILVGMCLQSLQVGPPYYKCQKMRPIQKETNKFEKSYHYI